MQSRSKWKFKRLRNAETEAECYLFWLCNISSFIEFFCFGFFRIKFTIFGVPESGFMLLFNRISKNRTDDPTRSATQSVINVAESSMFGLFLLKWISVHVKGLFVLQRTDFNNILFPASNRKQFTEDLLFPHPSRPNHDNDIAQVGEFSSLHCVST